jgi:Domain of unknown function (DUF5122) beta-propeller
MRIPSQRDGKIVVAGVANIDGGEDFALARYNLNGTPDLSFGTGGTVVTDFGRFAQASPGPRVLRLPYRRTGRLCWSALPMWA